MQEKGCIKQSSPVRKEKWTWHDSNMLGKGRGRFRKSGKDPVRSRWCVCVHTCVYMRLLLKCELD